MSARDEQETTITQGRDEEFISVWTNNPVHARKLEKTPSVIKTASNVGDEYGGWYKIPHTAFDALRGFKRAPRTMSDEQKQAASERLAAARKANK